MKDRSMTPRRVFVSLALLALALGPVLGQPKFPQIRPEAVGMSPARLDRIGAVMQKYVDDGKVAGVVTLVVRNGAAAYFKAFGKLDLARGTPMPTDGIFRIASQSKAVTSVAVMALVEEGKLNLGDPVSKYIPEFKDSKVAVASADKKAPGYTIVPAKREITVRDLLTHTAGISYGDGPAADLYKAAGIQGWSFVTKTAPVGEWIKKLARLPFDAQPGEKWVYGFNTDILGYLVEVVSGLSLDDYIQKRIAGPLGLTDTHFYLPEKDAGRLASVYGVGKDGQLELVEDGLESPFLKGPRVCFSGGAGLLSTAEDYARFLQMLGNGGQIDGVRVLSPKSVEAMTANQVGDLYGTRGQGFGLGFWTTYDVGRTGELGSDGAFGWGGAYYTTYWVDPAEKLVAVFMTQLLPAGGLDLQTKYKTLVYQSIVDSYEKK